MNLPEIKYDFNSSPIVATLYFSPIKNKAIRKWESLFMKSELPPQTPSDDYEGFYLKSISDNALKVDEALAKLKRLLWQRRSWEPEKEKEICQELKAIGYWHPNNPLHLCAQFSCYYRFFNENSRLAWFASVGHPNLDYRHVPDQCKCRFLMLVKKLKAIVIEEQMKNHLILEFAKHEPLLYPNELDQLSLIK